MFMIRIPEVTFHIREATDQMPGYEWRKKTTRDLFASKRVVLFAVPGCYTPTCTSAHLPGYENAHSEMRSLDIDEVYCVSVNDSYTMNAWFNSQGIEHVKAIPDGSGEFTRKMGFLIDKSNQGMGMRSWRYSMVIADGVVEYLFAEPGMADNVDEDPFVVSDADTMLHYLRQYKELRSQADQHTEQAQPAAAATAGTVRG